MSYQVIARKYRPQVFDEVVGQPLITGTLKNAILHDRVAHGYIFSGARGVGKTTTARILAKALNCAQGPTVNPDGTCPSCVEIAAGNSVDVLEIDAASNRGIDEIRELRETVRYLPARDRYKVFIIDEVHMLTTEAFNALLKTLEEPPPRSLFILATTEPHKLPSTIQSRCQHFAFRLLDYAEIYAQLERICASEKVQANEKALSAIAQAAEGSLRDALSILDQVIAACGDQLDEKRVRQLLGVVPATFMNRLVEAIRAGNARQALESVSQLAAEGYELGHFCGEFTRYLRDLMVARSCGAQSPLLQVPQDERQALEELARQFSEEDLSRFFQIMLRTEAELRYSLQPRFHLELGLMKLVHARRLASLEGLLGELRTASPSAPGPPRPGSSSTGSGTVKMSAAPSSPPHAKRQEIAAAVGSLATPRPLSVMPAPLPQVPQPSSATAPATAEPGTLGASPSEAIRSEPARAGAPPDDERLSAIKALIFGQSKLLGSCLEPLVGWRFENGEVRFSYAKKDSWAADLLKSRERQEALRAACTQVLGEAVKVCVTLVDSEEPALGVAPSVKERAGRHPVVEAFRRHFDCVVVEVKDLSQG
ncbi:MAG TPA: DNA polymerase III subunit gamma/tau [Terriglobia bacterium]|nr:DNA polymerase III subunit gamma/tau [Terriglobia bacterium]